MRLCSDSSDIKAGTPPAASRSSRWSVPAGLILQRLGVFLLNSLKRSMLSSMVASLAIAGRWSTVLVEPPRAISTAIAFRKAFRLAISLGLIFFFTSSIAFIPAILASLILLASTAGMVPLPGSPMPRASVKQFMVLAVNMPAQLPHPGQATSSRSLSSSSFIFPALTLPTASKTVMTSVFLPFLRPASIGPPLMIIAGIFMRRAAMSIPGVILSQLVTKTNPSNGWAIAITSIESAISSLLAREYFMPVWCIAMPSQTPIVPNITGVPPA